jgi:hypothetical protein
MKFLLTILLILNFGVSNSQNFIDGIIKCSKHWANEKLRLVVEKEILDNNFKFEKSKTLIEVYNENEDKLERLTLNEFNKSDFPATQLWLNYKVMDENQILTELGFPFNLNCTTPWNKKDIQEILEPYLKVLQNKTKIDLKKALEIGYENGLREICYWDIDYEKRKLIWTIKDKENNVLKVNAKNGKVCEKYIELRID